MALISLGKNAVFVNEIGQTRSAVTRALTDSNEDEIGDAKKKLDDVKKDIQTALAAWIPGDFIVAYGTLITAWSSLSRSFTALVLIALISSVAFVWLGAFAASGLKNPSKEVTKRLAARTVVGWPLCVLVAVTIPASGWNDFKWYRDNEASVILTAGLITGLLVLALKGAQLRGWLQQDES